jgi:hypothetical protein
LNEFEELQEFRSFVNAIGKSRDFYLLNSSLTY